MDCNVSRALLVVAPLVLLSSIANAQTPPRGGIPVLSVESNCKATQEIDKTLAEPQSYDACMGDEKTAQQQLGSVWSSIPEAVRTQCYGEAVAGGVESYVDLLSCIQMGGFGQSSTPATSLRGASKNRNKKG
jgi:hypothetical protein